MPLENIFLSGGSKKTVKEQYSGEPTLEDERAKASDFRFHMNRLRPRRAAAKPSHLAVLAQLVLPRPARTGRAGSQKR